MVYTIIIPHKNVPNLLRRLLNSIPERADTEVVIVDDHSDEGKVDFANFPGNERKDVRIVFLDESKGAGYARNKGIELAKGKWLLFADADDFYTDNLNFLLDKYKEDTTTDIVYLNAQSYFENDGHTEPQYYSSYFERFEKNKFYSEKVLRYNIFTPWSRMVKRELIEAYKLRYEEIPVGNDKMFCLQCSKYAKTINNERAVVYNYFRQSEGSVTYGYSRALENVKSQLQLQSRVNSLYNDVNYIFKQSYLYGYLRSPLKGKDLKALYKRHMRENKVSLLSDIKNMCICIIAKALRII